MTYNNGPWSIIAREQRWQTLPPAVAPYAREPQLNVLYNKYNVGGFDYGAEMDYTRFTTTVDDATKGQRAVLQSVFELQRHGPGLFRHAEDPVSPGVI